MILRHQPDNLPSLADHELGVKGKPAREFGAELRPGHWPPDHEGAGRTDADGTKVLQLFGEPGRPEGPVTADVDPSQKNDECHEWTVSTMTLLTPFAVNVNRRPVQPSQNRPHPWTGGEQRRRESLTGDADGGCEPVR